eukprot:3328134-Rhodomonas_salina.2
MSVGREGGREARTACRYLQESLRRAVTLRGHHDIKNVFLQASCPEPVSLQLLQHLPEGLPAAATNTAPLSSSRPPPPHSLA